MTHSGGKPHAVGDRGQRYEITFFDPHDSKRKVLGWAEKIEGAENMAAAIREHPSWRDPEIKDRRP